MMGATHKATGLCAGAYVVCGVRVAMLPPPVPTVVAFGCCAVGVLIMCLAGRAALWNDLDHPTSRATNSFGPITYFIHFIAHTCAVWVFDTTATELDRKAGDFRGHRGLAHFAITALVVGGLLGWAAGALTARSPVIVLGVLAGVLTGLVASWAWTDVVGFVLGTVVAFAVWTVFPLAPVGALAIVTGLLGWIAGRQFLDRKFGLLCAVAAAGATLALLPYPTVDWQTSVPNLALGVGVGVGAAVATGMLSHSIGDGATKTGVPLLWPLKIQGRRFYPVHIRSEGNRLHTGKDELIEQRIRMWSAVLSALAVLGWIPGLAPWLWSVMPWNL